MEKNSMNKLFLSFIFAVAGLTAGAQMKHQTETVQNSFVVLNPDVALNTVNLTASYTFVLPAGKASAKTCLQFVQPASSGYFEVKAPSNVLGFRDISHGQGLRRTMQCFIYSPSQFAWVPQEYLYY
jgi:hypothetical protein